MLWGSRPGPAHPEPTRFGVFQGPPVLWVPPARAAASSAVPGLFPGTWDSHQLTGRWLLLTSFMFSRCGLGLGQEVGGGFQGSLLDFIGGWTHWC